MARKGPASGATDGASRANNGAALVNFQYARPPSSSATSHPQQQQQRQNNNNHRSYNNNTNSRRSNQHRNTRRQPQPPARSNRSSSNSSMFYLHSSANHAFCLTRVPNRLEQYTFQDADTPVSWQAVRLVKYFVTVSATTFQHDETCPICLDSFTCARITKCGHVFCLPCLIHHAQAFAESHATTGSSKTAATTVAPKCPCCAMPTCLSDVRPVLLQTTTAPAPAAPANNQTVLQLVKLARAKHCSSPYLMLPTAPKRSSPRAAPCMADVDAAYCKFNFVDPHVYQEHLQYNMNELRVAGGSSSGSSLVFNKLAFDFVQEEYRKALLEAPAELEMMEQFASPASGMYQSQQLQYHMQQQQQSMEYASSNDQGRGNDESHIFPPVEDLASNSNLLRTRSREDSIVSNDSQPSVHGSVNHRTLGGSMYLDNPEDHVFYQAQDGTLCFLCGFNMKCLQAEYATTCQTSNDNEESRPPLPDAIHGRIVEVERILLTQEKRQRFRFLSHLPVDSEIVFVELSLGHVLSKETKRLFQKEFNKRKQMRTSRVGAEKAADARLRRKEEARIEEMKSRFQRIDPNDEFFRSPEPEPLPVMTGAEFGPSVSSTSSAVASSPALSIVGPNAALSFSRAIQTTHCLRDHDFPSLGSEAPALGTSPTRSQLPQWGKPLTKKSASAPDTTVPHQADNKRSKGKKVLLFSTGGNHGVY